MAPQEPFLKVTSSIAKWNWVPWKEVSTAPGLKNGPHEGLPDWNLRRRVTRLE